MNVVVGTDLLIRSRIAAAVDRARANWSRVDEPIDLPPRTASTLFSSTGGTARRDGPMRSRRGRDEDGGGAGALLALYGPDTDLGRPPVCARGRPRTDDRALEARR